MNQCLNMSLIDLFFKTKVGSDMDVIKNALLNNVIVSIIIPVFKVEDYIEECLESVFRQEIPWPYKNKIIEVICINDGTPDGSVNIIKKYMDLHSNLVLIEQVNQGQSVARNNALNIARGEYVLFLDSDDLLPDEAISSLLKIANETKSEVIVSHAKAFNGRRSWFIESHAEVASASFRKVKFFHHSILVNSPPPWGKLYKKDLLDRNNIRFPVGIKLAEDWIFVIHAMYKSNHISSTPAVTYLYRGRDDEDNPSCTQVVNEKVFSDLIKVYILSEVFNLPEKQTWYAKLFILRGIMYRLLKFTQDNTLHECKIIYKKIKAFLNSYIEINTISIFTPGRRLPLFLIYYGFYSEAYRVINNNYNIRFLGKIYIENTEVLELIKSDYTLLHDKYVKKNSIKSKVLIWKKEIISLTWSCKYFLAQNVSKFIYGGRNISLIGERLGNTANDSSFYLFDYIQKNNIEKRNDYYYVIKKNAKTKGNLDEFKNKVVWYGSFKHFVIFCAANKYIFSDSMKDVFFHWVKVSDEHASKERYFLQHGIFALNRATGYYDRNSMYQRGELPTKFIVSSDYEKYLVCRDFGFEAERVAVTGLSRYDNLPARTKTRTKKILLLLTWRDELTNVSNEVFFNSQYYKRIHEIMCDDKIKHTLDKYGYSIQACFHHKVSHFISVDNEINMNYAVYDMSQVNVQELLLDSDIMITDFSSACFDVLYQNKPVIFYWFDEVKFFGRRGGPLIDPLTDIPGDICRTVKDVTLCIKRLLNSNMFVSSERRKNVRRFFKYRDKNNCKRIFNVINNNFD